MSALLKLFSNLSEIIHKSLCRLFFSLFIRGQLEFRRLPSIREAETVLSVMQSTVLNQAQDPRGSKVIHFTLLNGKLLK